MEQELVILKAVQQLGALTHGQISRFLFEGGIVPEYDLLPALAALKEKGQVNQVLSPLGIVLEITQEGRSFLDANAKAIPESVNALITQKATEYERIFMLEQNYLAQYSEQSSGVVPVTLSIREADKIVLRVNLIVNTIEAAKKICADWMKNSPKAYRAFWAAIAGGMPEPDFWRDRPEEV